MICLVVEARQVGYSTAVWRKKSSVIRNKEQRKGRRETEKGPKDFVRCVLETKIIGKREEARERSLWFWK